MPSNPKEVSALHLRRARRYSNKGLQTKINNRRPVRMTFTVRHFNQERFIEAYQNQILKAQIEGAKYLRAIIDKRWSPEVPSRVGLPPAVRSQQLRKSARIHVRGPNGKFVKADKPGKRGTATLQFNATYAGILEHPSGLNRPYLAPAIKSMERRQNMPNLYTKYLRQARNIGFGRGTNIYKMRSTLGKKGTQRSSVVWGSSDYKPVEFPNIMASLDTTFDGIDSIGTYQPQGLPKFDEAITWRSQDIGGDVGLFDTGGLDQLLDFEKSMFSGFGR